MKALSVLTEIDSTIVSINQVTYKASEGTSRVIMPSQDAYVKLHQADTSDEGIYYPAKSMTLYIGDAKTAQQLSAHFGALARALRDKGVE